MTAQDKFVAACQRIRGMIGPDRRAACRALLAGPDHGVNFTDDVYAVRISQKNTLAEMAKLIGWKKSPASALSLGGAFFMYLQRDMMRNGVPDAPVVRVAAKRVEFKYGKGA